MAEARFLSYKEFAAAVGVSERTVSDLVKRGELPVVPLGRRRLIPAIMVDELERRALAGFTGAVAELEVAS